MCRRCVPASSIGLSVADSLIRSGSARTILLIGAETMSRLLDWSDRTTCVLFGDGAGAVVLQAHEGKGDNSDQGVLNTRIFSDGRLHDMLYIDGGVFLDPARRASCACRARKSSGTRSPISPPPSPPRPRQPKSSRLRDRLVRAPPGQSAHPGRHRPQAGHRTRQGDFHRGRAWQHLGGLGAAGAGDGGPGRADQAGDLVLLEAMGGGFTWGAALIRW